MSVLVRDGFPISCAFIFPLPVAVLPPPVARRPGGVAGRNPDRGRLPRRCWPAMTGAFLSHSCFDLCGPGGKRHAAGGDGSAGLARNGGVVEADDSADAENALTWQPWQMSMRTPKPRHRQSPWGRVASVRPTSAEWLGHDRARPCSAIREDAEDARRHHRLRDRATCARPRRPFSGPRAVDHRHLGEIALTDKAEEVAPPPTASLLLGVGAFADCRAGLNAVPGMVEALEEVVHGRAGRFSASVSACS